MSILLAPHSDDEALFASGIILRYKPEVIVVTDARNPAEVGARWEESQAGCAVLGAKVGCLSIPNNDLNVSNLFFKLLEIKSDLCFAPALQHGHPDHDMVYNVAYLVFGDKLVCYSTYGKPVTNFVELMLNGEEMELKRRACACYKSQHHMPYFQNLGNEWISRLP